MAYMGCSGAGGKQIDEKAWSRKFRVRLLFMLKQAMFGHLDQDVGPHDFSSKPIQNFLFF